MTVNVKMNEHNCLITIYEMEIPSGDMNFESGNKISAQEENLICTIDLWNKYYFPTFNNDNNQWYYNVKGDKESGFEIDPEGNEDEIGALKEVMDFAIQIGLKEGNISLY